MSNIVYHGSSHGNVDKLVANKSTHQKKCIYATDNKAVAMMFMGRGNGDLDTVKHVENGVPVLVERRPGVLEKLYNKGGYMYELPGDSFNHYDYLWEPEVISFEKEIVPISCEYHENILKSLEKMLESGMLKMYRYPERPDYIPFDNSDLIDKYIRFQNMGIENAVSSLLKVYPEFIDEVLSRTNDNNNDLNRSR